MFATQFVALRVVSILRVRFASGGGLQHIRLDIVLRAISLDKDVDGLHPINLGRLVLRGMYPTFVPCTPLGCLELLRHSGVQIEKKHAVVIGCSNAVGLPTAMLLQVLCSSSARGVC